MQLKTLLNSVTDYKSFVFTKVYENAIQEGDTTTKYLVAEMEPRKNGQGVCPECGRKCTTYVCSSKSILRFRG